MSCRVALRLLGVPLPVPATRAACRQHRGLGHLVARHLGVQAQAAQTAEQRPSYLHMPGSDPLLYLSLGQLAERAAARHGRRDAVVAVEEGVRLTYHQLLDKADRLAAGLLRLGLQPGDRVALWGPNTWRWIVTKIAVARAGMVSVDMNPVYLAPEVHHCLSLARVSAVICAERHRGIDFHDLLCTVVPELAGSDPQRGIRSAAMPDLKQVVTMAGTAKPGCLNFDEVLASSSDAEVAELQAHSAAVCPDSGSYIQFSSGTTGKPKAIVLSHKSVVNNGYCNGKRFGLHEKHHSVCLQPPLFHVFGSVVVLSSLLNHGATLVLPTAGYDPARAIEAALAERCTVMTGTPTMYVDLVRAVERRGPGAILHGLELAITGGAPITPELVRKMKNTLGVSRICSVYGLSETSAVVFQGTKDDTLDHTAETVGRLGEHLEAKVVDLEGRMVPFGTPGELWIRGYVNMIEYFQNEKATRETLVNGWVRTGDKFVLYENGYGRIVGRIKDMVIRGGENIYPKEVEDAVAKHPDVAEAEVVGVPDERMGEELCACLKVRDGATVGALDLRKFLEGKIAKYKIPRYVLTLPDFPKTQSGKIQKFKLRQTCAELLGQGKLDDSRAAHA
ncbi:Medium-chain acyl-CoA ligase ACSF2, mitochondrial [Frankliniella fusca]|uniref:Medium-chain acyl-CoA ligase ACSF2, mitochondrial n=1 Tax=Frankliniella fusca TaxID=407009 RepID=A0AAE1LSJ9_9NEOP|nr:Medium-chain acyl-CoA ligase ACSF2, mitochondrial [Frankliniella fusca]